MNLNFLYLLLFLLLVSGDSNTTEESLVECKVSETVHSNAQLEEYQSCQVIVNDLVIEDYEDPLIQFNLLQRIDGDFIIKNSPGLVRIESNSLNSIGNSFSMHKLNSLSLISFPSLSQMKKLKWEVIPLLSLVTFNQDIEDIEDIVISDTSLTGFTGFQTKYLNNLNINNNRFLDIINCQVEKINGHLHITSNGKNLQVDLPNLTLVHNVSINDVQDLQVPKLEEIKESISFNNNEFNEIDLSALEKIGGTLSLFKNFQLSKLKLDNLEEINGGLMIINNTRVSAIDFLPKLQKIDGGLELLGKFATIKFPSLKLIRGSVSIKNGNSNFDCNELINTHLNQVIRGGKIECLTDFANSKDFDHFDYGVFNASTSNWSPRYLISNLYILGYMALQGLLNDHL